MKVAIFFGLLAVAAADFEVVKIESCVPPKSNKTEVVETEPTQVENPAPLCEVHEVRINPCRKNKHCILKKGEPAAMSFDFTPNFAASTLKTMAYWAATAGDVPFDGLGGDDGCAYTSCPLEPGKKQTFLYNLRLQSKLPSGTFALKWKVWNTENESADVCCFKTTIQLKKGKSK